MRTPKVRCRKLRHNAALKGVRDGGHEDELTSLRDAGIAGPQS